MQIFDHTELTPPNWYFKKKNATAFDESHRFSSAESARRYLENFSLKDKICCFLLMHPATARYHAATSVREQSQEKIDECRGINYFFGNRKEYNRSNPMAEMKLYRGRIYLIPRNGWIQGNN